MPLNRRNILPPRSLFDLFQKMAEGHYTVDTEVVRENMRVITPPLEDTSEIGVYISTACHNMPIYKLEKYVGGGKYLIIGNFCKIFVKHFLLN